MSVPTVLNTCLSRGPDTTLPAAFSSFLLSCLARPFRDGPGSTPYAARPNFVLPSSLYPTVYYIFCSHPQWRKQAWTPYVLFFRSVDEDPDPEVYSGWSHPWTTLRRPQPSETLCTRPNGASPDPTSRFGRLEVTGRPRFRYTGSLWGRTLTCLPSPDGPTLESHECPTRDPQSLGRLLFPV